MFEPFKLVNEIIERYAAILRRNSQIRNFAIPGYAVEIQLRGRLREQPISAGWKTLPIHIRQFSLLPNAQAILERSFKKNESSRVKRCFNVSYLFLIIGTPLIESNEFIPTSKFTIKSFSSFENCNIGCFCFSFISYRFNFEGEHSSRDFVRRYVEWNLHQPTENEWHWTGDADVVEFINIAQEEGLFVLLRPGPYICAERDFVNISRKMLYFFIFYFIVHENK